MPLAHHIRTCKLQKVGIFLFTLFIFNGCVTSRQLVPKTYSFFILKQYGTIKIEEKENELSSKQDTVLVIYIEATSNKLSWDTAWYNYKVYSVSAQIINNGTYEAGFDKNSNKPITVSVNEGNTLYQLQFQLSTTAMLIPPTKDEFNLPMLRFRYKEKLYLLKINAPVELTTLPPM